MRIQLSLALFAPLALLLGCGGNTSGNAGAASASNTAALSGDWLALNPAANLNTSSIDAFTGALQFNGGSVTGTFRVLLGPS